MKFAKLILISLLLSPTLVFALDFNLDGSTFADVIQYILDIIFILIPILFALAFIVFFWGLSKFILSSSGNQADLKKGKDYMMWGILALFILVSFRAIIIMVSKEFEIGDGKTYPQLPTDGNIESVNSTINYQ
jgi:hypothetical protein